MYFPTDNKDLKSKLCYLYEGVKEQLADERDKWDRFHKLYNSFVDEGNYPLPFKVFIPWAHSVVESKIPRFVNGLLYRNPIVHVTAVNPDTNPKAVSAASRLLNGKWMTDKRTYQAIMMMFKESLIYGTSFGAVRFEKKRRMMNKRVPTGMPGITNVVPQSVIVSNRPVLDHLDLWLTYPDLDAPDIDSMSFFITEHLMEMEDLYESSADYKNLDELKELGPYADLDDFVNMRMEGAGRFYRANNLYKNHDFHNPRHILQCVLRMTKRDGTEVYKIVTIGNKEVTLRNNPINFWPIVTCRNTPQPHEPLGMSDIFQMETLQLAMNDFVNMDLTSSLMSIAKGWMIGDAAQADPAQFVLEPLNIVQVSDVNQVKELGYKELGTTGDRMINTLTQAVQNATGIQDYFQGMTPQRQEYPSTVMALQNASEARTDCQIKWGERETVSQVAHKFIECAQSDLTDPEYIANADGVLESFTLDDIQGLYEFETPGVSSGIKEFKRQAYKDFAAITSELLGDAMPIEMRFALAKGAAKTFDGVEGLDEIFEKYGPQAGGPQEGLIEGNGLQPGMGSIPGIDSGANQFAQSPDM